MANKISANPMKPALAAKIKNSQSLGGGLKQGKGGAKFVTAANPGKGLKQGGTGANKPAATKVGVNKLNKKPISAQPKSPRKNSPAKQLHNSVSKGDTARLRKASNLASPAMSGGGFKGFIRGK